MSDSPADLPTEPPAPEAPVYPWDAPAEATIASPPAGRRERHDAFNEARKRAFLSALAKCGCLLDACRAAGVVARTVYRHQDKDAAFAEHIRLAFAMAATPLELTAFQRAVEGVEQPFACGGEVHVRRHYDSGLLRLLLQGANPKKYGRNPGFSRKRLLKHERKAMRREIEAEVAEKMALPPAGPVRERIVARVMALKRHKEPGMLAAGWTRTPDGDWVPPGYAPIPGWTPPESASVPFSFGDQSARGAGSAHPSDPPNIV